jgi:hypothetical protein
MWLSLAKLAELTGKLGAGIGEALPAPLMFNSCSNMKNMLQNQQSAD